jgi:hypothetical protein
MKPTKCWEIRTPGMYLLCITYSPWGGSVETIFRWVCIHGLGDVELRACRDDLSAHMSGDTYSTVTDLCTYFDQMYGRAAVEVVDYMPGDWRKVVCYLGGLR